MFEDNLLRTGEKFIVGPLRRAAHNKEKEYEKCDGYHFRLKLIGTVYFTLTTLPLCLPGVHLGMA